jgi:hypothetical protein
MEVEIDPAGGTSYSSVGSSQLLSVPYAIYAANSSASGTVNSINTTAPLTGGPITTSGSIGLSNSGVAAGSYGTGTQVPQINIDAFGRITSATNVPITGGGITGSGSTNYVPKFTSASALGNSLIYDNGTRVGVGTTASGAVLHTYGSSDFSITLGGGAFDHQAFIAQAGTTTTANVSRAIVGYAANSSLENHGLFGDANGGGVSNNVGVFGYSTNATGGDNLGIYGVASNGATNYGIYGNAIGTGYAGYFTGAVSVTGMMSKGGGSFKIDHPLDPENKYLYHSFVESPDMMNIYNGNVVTDANGDATITLPDYFEALNKDFRYQLTVIGSFAQAMISKKVAGNKFEIKTNSPNVEVSWQVTGIRHDKFADANRIVPEVEKEAAYKGRYMHAKEWGVPDNKSIDALTRPKSTSADGKLK